MKEKRWEYDEMTQIGTDYTQDNHVREYDDRMQRFRDVKAESEDILCSLEINQNHTVLEIGTGTGELAIEMARRCKLVYAVDVSPAMLEYAHRKASNQGVRNIVFCHAGFLTYVHHGDALDAVVSQLALHHLPDFWKFIALRRISGFIKEGGKLYLRDIVYPSQVDDYGKIFTDWVAGMRLVAGNDLAKEIEDHISKEYSTLDWIMEGILQSAGMNLDRVIYPETFMGIYVCTKKSSHARKQS